MSELGAFLINSMKQYPDSCIMENGRKFTYKEVLEETVQLADDSAWKRFKRKKCAVVCKETIQMAKIMIALWNVDAIVIPLSMNYGKKHCENILETTKPEYLITEDEELLDILAEGARWEKKNQYICAELDGEGDSDELEGVSLIMCTSGTTGKPKGAMLYSSGIVKNVLGIAGYFDIASDDAILIARPLYHGAVLTGELLVSLYKGLDIVCYSQVFNPIDIKKLVEKYQISVLCGTPTLMHHLAFLYQLSHIESHIRVMAVSGECMTQELAKSIRTIFQKTKIYNVYGLTEASPRVSYLSDKMFDEHPEAVGVPMEGIAIRIVDSKGNELPPGEYGEVIVHTPSLMKGYYRKPELTRQKIQNGWLHTGDIGYFDQNRLLYIVSRKDDMIIKAGMNIYPKEIENELVKLPEVKEVLAYGKREESTEEIVVQIVLEKEYETMTKKELLARFAKQLPAYQLPSTIQIVGQLPRNASGKIVRPKKKQD